MNNDEKFMKRAIELSRLAVRHRNDPFGAVLVTCLLYTSPSPRDPKTSRMPSSA